MTKPINPADYVPSQAVRYVMGMIDGARQTGPDPWLSEDERSFRKGARWQLNVTFRGLVELETGIHDPDDLDELCADLIIDAEINRC